MKNKFVDTLLFLEEFQLREAPEKAAFFAQLQSNLDLFPEDIARNKILPKLIHVNIRKCYFAFIQQTYEYGDAGAHILVPMFRLGKLLEEDEVIVIEHINYFSFPCSTNRGLCPAWSSCSAQPIAQLGYLFI